MTAGMNLLALCCLTAILTLGRTEARGAGSMLLMEPEIPKKGCRYIRSYDLLQAQCKDLKLESIPDNLKGAIEVLDARENRIRALNNKTLKNYPSLRYLYLQDNFVNLADDAFEATYYLEVLDMSKNSLVSLPKSIFQMLYLRNLYLNNNNLKDEHLNVTNVKSPLNWLHLFGNQLTQLPKLSPLSKLTVLNISYNSITHVSVDEIAPLCSLQKLDITGNPIKFNESSCDCYEFKEWIHFRKIELFYPLDCPLTLRERCSGQEFSNRTMSLYTSCVQSLRTQAEAQKARSTWIWIASCLGAFMFCICVAICCMHKRNKNKRQRLKEQEIHAANNANTEQLLNKEANSHEQS